MSAQNTDLFRKLARKWVGQIGAGAVADGSVTTIPLSSTTNLPTDTAVTLVIDRVDANGTKTPTLEETIVGVVSGSNIVSAVRGVEGTAQAHSAGAVVELLVTADGYNDMIDGILAEHNQLGGHTNITASNISASAVTESLHYDLLAGGDLRDANDNELLNFTQTASAVNEFTVANAVTGTNPSVCATGDDTNIGVDLVPKGTGNVRSYSGLQVDKTAFFDAEFDNGDSGTTDTIDWTVGNKQKSTLTGNVTFTFTDPSGPANLVLKLVQDATGSRTVTWPASVKWPSGTAPTLSTAASSVDIIALYFDGTNYYGQSSLDFS